MKKLFWIMLIPLLIVNVMSQVPSNIKLSSPNLKRGLPVMEALSKRASATEFKTNSLKLEDLSDLVWAANGINRAETGKRTAPSAINAQDIDLYVFLPEGAYFYEPKSHTLVLVAEGDFRKEVSGPQENMANAPVYIAMVADISRFTRGDEQKKMIWAAEDAGIVSQNINIFCAGTGMQTRTRATMNIPKLKEILKLKDAQFPILNNPVSY
jgi:SagB-type dehydrogenase family enzyme